MPAHAATMLATDFFHVDCAVTRTAARTEVTYRMLIFNQRHLRSALARYAARQGQRPHRSGELRPPRPGHPIADLSQKQIKRRPVLGGLINEYERAVQKPRSRPVAEIWNPTGS
jgi:hypothetical protein